MAESNTSPYTTVDQDGVSSNNIHSSSSCSGGKKPNTSHFDAGSGVLAAEPPQRPARRAFPQKNQPSEEWYMFDPDKSWRQGVQSSSSSSSNRGSLLQPQTASPAMLPRNSNSRGHHHNQQANHEGGRPDTASCEGTWKDRKERARQILEKQEEERRQKAEEWRQQAVAAQKHREQMEAERKRVLQEARAKEQEKFRQMEERRKALELADQQRREALKKKNQEREERLEHRRKNSDTARYAFGSSTPRMIETRVDSSTDVGGARRSTSSTNVNIMSQSMYVKTPGDRGLPGARSSSAAKNPRSSSVYGLDKAANSGNEGLSREGTSSSRLSPATPGSGDKVVHRRLSSARGGPGGGGRPRPISIAVCQTGQMTQSMYEKRSPASAASTPTNPRHHSGKHADSSKSRKSQDDDVKSTTSSTSSVKGRKTPAQVKRENAAKKAKSASPPAPTPPHNEEGKSTTPQPRQPREATPDIISDSDKAGQPATGAVTDLDVCENTDSAASPDEQMPAKSVAENEASEAPVTPAKKIITSEDEAKAKLAEKRREMKEKKEREAELERQRLAELERIEEERRQKEEEEERRAMEEAERFAAEARKAEEERLQKAIAEAQKKEEEERLKKEEEERARKEQELKAREEAERKQAELDEKFRKEEEERAARKARLAAIMARTRQPQSTPTKSTSDEPTTNGEGEKLSDKKEQEGGKSTPPPAESNNSNCVNGVEENHSKNTEEDSKQPDLLSDTNERNQILSDFDPLSGNQHQIDGSSSDSTAVKEVTNALKSVDISSHVEEQDVDCQESEPVLDQFIDLDKASVSVVSPGSDSPSPGPDQVLIGTPIIAFEDANTTNTTITPQVEVPTADLLS